MSELAKAFTKGMGRPDPATQNGLRFRDTSARMFWESLYAEIGAGWFLDQFVYLFGPGLERLERCLDAWSFVVPPKRKDRMILGRNAYGAILVLEDANSVEPKVYVLEPFVVTYWTHEYLGIENLFGMWLPERRIPHFLDTDLYDAWIEAEGKHLPEDVILAPKVPQDLGGKRTPDNFQPEDIFEYYETTVPIYAKTFADARRQPAMVPDLSPRQPGKPAASKAAKKRKR